METTLAEAAWSAGCPQNLTQADVLIRKAVLTGYNGESGPSPKG